jgi:hypothetical protein
VVLNSLLEVDSYEVRGRRSFCAEGEDMSFLLNKNVEITSCTFPDFSLELTYPFLWGVRTGENGGKLRASFKMTRSGRGIPGEPMSVTLPRMDAIASRATVVSSRLEGMVRVNQRSWW